MRAMIYTCIDTNGQRSRERASVRVRCKRGRNNIEIGINNQQVAVRPSSVANNTCACSTSLILRIDGGLIKMANWTASACVRLITRTKGEHTSSHTSTAP